MDVQKNSFMKNQSGAALVVALVMMVVLTLIGLGSIFSSTFEIKITGRKRCSTDSFYIADCGAQVVRSNIDNFKLTFFDADTNLYNPPNNSACNSQLSILYDPTKEGAPRGFGVSSTNFEFQHFMVTSTGATCPDPVPSTTVIEEKVVRLIPTQSGGY